MKRPGLLIADNNQKIIDIPGLIACGQSGDRVSPLSAEELVPLPKGSDLFFLPQRHPMAFDPAARDFVTVREGRPVTAFLPPGYTNLKSPAYKEEPSAGILPLYSYAPVALYKNKLHVPALRIDNRKNHDTRCVNKTVLARKIKTYKGTKNRLILHLANCATVNGCPNAMNFFLGRYEAPLPTSPACNARCLGCISFQPEGSCPATQPRLTFVPTAQEIAEIALLHLKTAKDPVVSFGQGCEGEPLLQARVIEEAIRLIRGQTSRGTIHMNTNASLWKDIDKLCRAGLDSIRVSMNSVRAEFYERYYAPRRYSFDDVLRSIKVAKAQNTFVSLNYLVMPGFTDQKGEFDALVKLLKRQPVDMIQWRNLNYDPQLYFRRMKIKNDEPLLGLRTVIDQLRRAFPKLRHGYFNVPIKVTSSRS